MTVKCWVSAMCLMYLLSSCSCHCWARKARLGGRRGVLGLVSVGRARKSRMGRQEDDKWLVGVL